jgi:DNA polymerase III subunit beta
VLFRTERAVVYSRLVEGRFPNYQSVLPKNPATRVVLPVAAFQTAVRRAAIMTDENSKRVTFRFSKDNLTLSTVIGHTLVSRDGVGWSAKWA